MSLNEKLYGKGLVKEIKPSHQNILQQKFVMPPFSVWDTRAGYWQTRRRRWLRLGIQSEVGRKDGLTYKIPEKLADGRPGKKIQTETSIFDPVVAELALTWWCPPDGIVLDPFAGGSVRGIVASVLGYAYWGCELRAGQVIANKAQRNEATVGRHRPLWHCGDSDKILLNAPKANFVLSCPPYGNLEQYSNDPDDLSSLDYAPFLIRYESIVNKTCKQLKDNSFACFVVANFRNPATGILHDLVGDTVACFRKSGLDLYNECIIVNSVGSGAMRTNTSFVRGSRKVIKLHQNVLVFVKGDPRKAAAKIGGTEE